MLAPSRLVVLVAASLALAGCGGSDDLPAPARPAAGLVAAGPPAKAERPARTDGQDDAEADASFAVDPSALTRRAPSPKSAAPAADGISPGAPTDAEIRRELREMDAALKDHARAAGSGGPTAPATLNRDGTASPPKGAPEAVRRIIAAGNAIAKFPYVYGGGHASFIDTAYDCSGSVSYALAAVGIVDRPLVSGDFMKAGEAGRGRWVTIYSHPGHMYMEVAGLRFDTSGRGGPLGSRWQLDRRSSKGFAVRHPPGL